MDLQCNGYYYTVLRMNDKERAAEIQRLKRVLAASKAMGSGYKDRIAAIESQLDVLNVS